MCVSALDSCFKSALFGLFNNVFCIPQICGLKAENLEREKDFRQKLLSASKSHNETVESLKVLLQGLGYFVHLFTSVCLS